MAPGGPGRLAKCSSPALPGARLASLPPPLRLRAAALRILHPHAAAPAGCPAGGRPACVVRPASWGPAASTRHGAVPRAGRASRGSGEGGVPGVCTPGLLACMQVSGALPGRPGLMGNCIPALHLSAPSLLPILSAERCGSPEACTLPAAGDPAEPARRPPAALHAPEVAAPGAAHTT